MAYAHRCCEITLSGSRCKNVKVGKTEFCAVHLPELRCIALTKSGTQCRKPNCYGTKFCTTHAVPETCSICLGDIPKKSRGKIMCGHTFCTECINTWILENPTCPYCRIRVTKHETALAFDFGIRFGIYGDFTFEFCCRTFWRCG